jgi:hypothetical protein
MRTLKASEAYSIFSPEASPRVESARWTHQARTFLEADVVLIGDVSGTLPDIALIELDVASATGSATRVAVRTFPIALEPELLAAADRGVRAIGGAGFDALVARAQRVWQVPIAVEGDDRAPLVVAALLASVLLGPIVPPDEETIFGVKGARLRLQARGWPHSPA